MCARVCVHVCVRACVHACVCTCKYACHCVHVCNYAQNYDNSFSYIFLLFPLPSSPHLLPSSLLQLDQAKQTCSLTDTGCRSVLASLLAELLFVHGEQCCNVDTDLPRLFQEHFSIPLPLSPLKVDSPSALLVIPEIQDVVQVRLYVTVYTGFCFCLPVCVPCLLYVCMHVCVCA